MEFTELQSVRPDLVNKVMMNRTIGWLMKRRNGSGGFNINSRFLHVWNVTEHFVNSYACLALIFSGVSPAELEQELNWLKNNLSNMTDPYMMTVLANLFININELDIATQLCDSLLNHIKDDYISGAKTSITCSGGESLLVETTSLGLQAFIKLSLKTKNHNYDLAINNMIKFIHSKSKFGGYGNTQSTVLALKAIMLFDEYSAIPNKNGAITLSLDEQLITTVNVIVGEKAKIDLEGNLIVLPGSHSIKLSMEGGCNMPYSMGISYYNIFPDNSDKCSVNMSSQLLNESMKEGDVSEIMIQVRNVTNQVIPMTVAIIGLPGGLEPRHQQLKELVKQEIIDFYEIMGRDVVFYFRSLDPQQEKIFNFDVVAQLPGSYEGAASRCYLYYTDEYKHWNQPIIVNISPN